MVGRTYDLLHRSASGYPTERMDSERTYPSFTKTFRSLKPKIGWIMPILGTEIESLKPLVLRKR